VLLTVGDQVDFTGDGVFDAATVSDFEVFSNALAVGDRDAAGNVSIYLPLDVDPDGPGGGKTLAEGIYRLTVSEPAGPAGDLQLVVTSVAGRPVCVGTVNGGGFETDPDPANNTALVNTLVIDDAAGLAVGVFSKLTSSPTSDVPGLPGAKFGTGVDRPYRSPGGSKWILSADTDLGTSVDEVIIVGNLSPATGGNFGSIMDSANIASDNTLWFQADTTLSSSMDRFLLSKNGVIIEAQEGVTVPLGQAGGATDPWQGFATGSNIDDWFVDDVSITLGDAPWRQEARCRFARTTWLISR
jgi:hypothetical protein